VAYDVRGHGASDKPAAFSMADHVADLLGLCRALGLTRPALVGFSMGSYITLRTAELHPHAFGRIVLIVHGTADKVVDLSYARRAAEVHGSRATGSTTLVELDGAGHGFSRRHDREALGAFAARS